MRRARFLWRSFSPYAAILLRETEERSMRAERPGPAGDAVPDRSWRRAQRDRIQTHPILLPPAPALDQSRVPGRPSPWGRRSPIRDRSRAEPGRAWPPKGRAATDSLPFRGIAVRYRRKATAATADRCAFEYRSDPDYGSRLSRAGKLGLTCGVRCAGVPERYITFSSLRHSNPTPTRSTGIWGER